MAMQQDFQRERETRFEVNLNLHVNTNVMISSEPIQIPFFPLDRLHVEAEMFPIMSPWESEA